MRFHELGRSGPAKTTVTGRERRGAGGSIPWEEPCRCLSNVQPPYTLQYVRLLWIPPISGVVCSVVICVASVS